MCVEVYLGEAARGVLQLAGQPFALRAKVLLQAELDFGEVCVVHRPRPERTRISARSRVRDIKDVPQMRRVAAIVHERYALGSAPHIAAHALCPHVIFCTSACARALRVNQDLVGEVVLVVAGHGTQKRSPRFIAVRCTAERVMG